MILEGGTTFCWIYMQKFRSMSLRYQVEKEFIKMATKTKHAILGPLLASINTFHSEQFRTSLQF